MIRHRQESSVLIDDKYECLVGTVVSDNAVYLVPPGNEPVPLQVDHLQVTKVSAGYTGPPEEPCQVIGFIASGSNDVLGEMEPYLFITIMHTNSFCKLLSPFMLVLPAEIIATSAVPRSSAAL